MLRVVEAEDLLVGHSEADIIIVLNGVNAPGLLAVTSSSFLSLQQHGRSLQVAVVVFHETDDHFHWQEVHKLLVQAHLSQVKYQVQSVVPVLSHNQKLKAYRISVLD